MPAREYYGSHGPLFQRRAIRLRSCAMVSPMEPERRPLRTAMQIALAIAMATSLACAGKPFNVKTVPRVEPEAIGPGTRSAGLSVRAEAIWDEDWLLENFDANLILAGVLPVRVDIENPGAGPMAIEKLKLDVTGADGSRFKHLAPKKAMKAIEGYYGLTVRSKTGDKLYKADFITNALDLEAALAPGEHRQGFVFFGFPKTAPRRAVAATLSVGTKSDRTSVPLPVISDH
jgi:hypothetical protein